MWAAVLALGLAGAASATDRCATCHPKETAALARSGMGRSFRLAADNIPGGEFKHQPSGSSVRVRGLNHTVRRGSDQVERRIRYVVGSGNAGMSFLIRDGGWLYQSPASYFSARKAWGPSLSAFSGSGWNSTIMP